MQRQTNPTDNVAFELGAGSCWATLGVAGNALRGLKSLRVYFSGTNDSAAPKARGGEGPPQGHTGAAGSCASGDANTLPSGHTRADVSE